MDNLSDLGTRPRQKATQPLDVIFRPRHVALIGATEKEGSVGRTILWNLISNPFGGAVFPVNPKRSSVLGIRSYPSIGAVPEKVDLAVIVTPSPSVPALIDECVEAGIPGAIIISAGFKEAGAEGAEYERQILEKARAGGMRVIGPNCLGVMNPVGGLNATFASAMARPGNVGFISQSGALCTAILDWSLKENVGFSAFVSIGSMLDVDWGDLIYYLGDDPHTTSIVMYMESIGNARSFLSAAREVALTKPIILIKAGRTEAAAKAAASHTGSLAGSDDVLNAAFRRSGVLRVDRIADLFYMSEILAKQPLPKGNRLTILTNAGGPGVLATDALIATGGKLAPLSEETMEALNALLPPHWSHNNPIDILGDAQPERYAAALEIAAKGEDSDGLLVILTPQAMTDPTRTAEALRQHAHVYGKPILASWMGGADVAAGEAILNRANIPCFPYPDTAARLFNYMCRYSYSLKGIYETPSPATVSETEASSQREWAGILERIRATGRTLLTEYESKRLLLSYGIPAVETRIASTTAEAIAAAEAIGYPVVLKLHSETVTHKTDVGGVQLNLASPQAVEKAFNAIRDGVTKKHSAKDFKGVTVQPMVKLEGYELILGSSVDAQFGPVLLFGLGGQLVEVFQDRSLGLPPLNTTLAKRMMEQTKIYKALKGVRGRKQIDLDALEKLLVRFSHLVADQPWIKEIDINPLLASPEGLVALDARVILHDPGLREEDLPKLAIRPYPTRYIRPYVMKDGGEVLIRPIRPEDEPAMVAFHQTLSDQSVYFRYSKAIALQSRIAHDRLIRMCCIDYDREMALVAECANGETGAREIIGVGRMSKLHGSNTAEVNVIVSDARQRLGLGTELVRRLIEVAEAEKIARITGYIHIENPGMARTCEKLGFKITPIDGGAALLAELTMK